MKVSELRELLEGFDPDAEVHFTYDSGDYWHTRVAPVVSTVDAGWIKHSVYHNQPEVTGEDLDEGEVPEGGRSVVLLS